MKSKFYYEGHHQAVSDSILEYLISVSNRIPAENIHSTRAVGDTIESLISEKFGDLLADWCKEYSGEFARRSMADLAFTDIQGHYSIVDVKTHRTDTGFNMPNITSVHRLSRFYESHKNTFSLLMVKYTVGECGMIISNVLFTPIEFLDWECLTIGALGWGQIQIANSNTIKINNGYSRRKWMLELCDALLQFYPKEIGKIEDRITHFDQIRQHWESQEDIWS